MADWVLPDGWQWIQLGKICDIYGGSTPSRSRSDFFGDTIVWVTPSDLRTGGLIETVIDSATELTQAGLDSCSAPLLPAGAVLFSSRATIGKIAIAGVPLATNQGFANFVCGPTVNNFYLAWCLRALTEDIKRLASSTTYLEVSRGKLRSYLIPIPYPDDPARSLETQRRIVARIEALFAELRECRKLHQTVVEDTNRLMDAAVREVFDQPTDDWQTCELGNIAFIQTGTAKGRDFRDRKTVELPYLRVANVQAGYLDLDEIKTIRIAENEIARYRLQPGDLLLTEGGDFDKLGRGAVWQGEIEPCVHQNHIFAVRFDQDVIQPEFVEYEMQSWHAKRYFLGVAKKTTNLATINRTQLAAFPIKFPNLIEQQRIVTYLDSVKQQAAELQRIQGQDGDLLVKMEQVILAQAFRGEL